MWVLLWEDKMAILCVSGKAAGMGQTRDVATRRVAWGGRGHHSECVKALGKRESVHEDQGHLW